jgi:hypothetical protein
MESEEVWKDIEGHPDYKISSFGRVKTFKYGKERHLISSLIRNYCQIHLNRKTYRLHRLVAIAFIPNPENKEYVDHIDRDTKNNKVSNLRWATAKENANNCNHIIGDSGHRYITIIKNKNDDAYSLRIPTKKHKTFKTLKEAIKARDDYLNEKHNKKNTLYEYEYSYFT